jgi:Tol biopolymer transport system component
MTSGAAVGDAEGNLEMASIYPDGRPAWPSGAYDLSANGRFLIFPSTDFLYRRDLHEGVTETLSLSRRHDPRGIVTTAGGRFVAFSETDIVGPRDDRRLVADIYLHDVRVGATRRVIRIADRVGGAARLSEGPVLGGGTRYVAFTTRDPDFARMDNNERRDVFVLDRRSGRVELVSAAPGGHPGNGLSGGMAMTADGRVVVFSSSASNLVPGDTNDSEDIFLRNLDTNSTTRVNVTNNGGQAGKGSAQWATISSDGSTVAFAARARSLDSAATDNGFEVFVRDLAAQTTTRLAPGTQNGYSLAPVLSADGRYVAYSSSRPDITDTPGCTNTGRAVYLHDRLDGTTTCLSPYLDPATAGQSYGARMSAVGNAVAFLSDSELLSGAGQEDRLYLWRRTAAGTRARAK